MTTPDLRRLLAERAEAEGPSLRAQLGRLHRLPRRLRADARTLAEADALAAHPRLARLADPRALARAEGRMRRHLLSRDPRAARARARADAVALMGFYVFVAGAGVVAWLAWSG